jgi:hypothetical protein
MPQVITVAAARVENIPPPLEVLARREEKIPAEGTGLVEREENIPIEKKNPAPACELCGRAGGQVERAGGGGGGCYVHDGCALWSPNCFEDDEGNMCNVSKEVRNLH